MHVDPLALRALGLAGMFALAACRHPPRTPAPANPPSEASAPSLRPGVFPITPRTELYPQGPVGTGDARCQLMVYAWDAQARCRVQVNHCALAPDRQGVVCMSLADERTVACGATFDACGQTVRCDCPTGAPEAVPDEPGTVHLTREAGEVRANDGRCEARVTLPDWARNGPAPAPCILAIRERERPDAPWTDRTEMLSCGVRSTACGRPVRCDCPAP